VNAVFALNSSRRSVPPMKVNVSTTRAETMQLAVDTSTKQVSFIFVSEEYAMRVCRSVLIRRVEVD
jgi:hypothetical protein